MSAAAYSRLQKVLHWAVVILILFQLIVHDDMEDAWSALSRGLEQEPPLTVWAHIAAGVGVLVFALWRIALRAARGAPEAPGGEHVRRAAKWGHRGLYALMVLMPLSGLAAWFGGVGAAAAAHGAMFSILLLLVVGHIVAALVHHFVLKDGLLSRMR